MLKAKIQFYSSLANWLRAGLPLQKALRVPVSSELNRATAILYNAIQQGNTLSEAMASCSEFSKVEQALIHVGEISGSLDKSAEHLREICQQKVALRSKIASALFYPALCYAVAVPLLGIIHLAMGQIGSDGFSTDGWGMSITIRCIIGWGVPIAAFFLFRLLWKWFINTHLTGVVISCLPFFGTLQHRIETAAFFRTFGICLGSGIDMQNCIALGADSCSGGLYSQRFRKILNAVTYGQRTFSEAFNDISTLRDDRDCIPSLLATGEATGTLDEFAGRVAAMESQAAQTSLERFAVVLPVAIHVGLLIYLGLQIISFYADYIGKSLAL